ncbi:leucyl/phenylalanyl-tRNA--protein transferase [Litorimonas sp. WD9-15]|uniref:leucyl/phenylalanyl-tRNA--protein transferase n=1 Tax=Litorimonas sp. WD9-15 TaxID=3418716 RepID=UPI003D010BC7
MEQGFGPDALIKCYRHGIFPMSDDRTDERLFLVDPEMRGILPLDALHISKSMRKFRRQTDLRVTLNTDFPAVIKACAEARENTWISHGIEGLYTILHHRGEAHSVEVWQGKQLVGGLYGVSQGGAFFGESMFSRATNASKFALIHLVEHLNKRGFVLLDTQFITDHLASLGAIEIPRDTYQEKLKKALAVEARFD